MRRRCADCAAGSIAVDLSYEFHLTCLAVLDLSIALTGAQARGRQPGTARTDSARRGRRAPAPEGRAADGTNTVDVGAGKQVGK